MAGPVIDEESPEMDDPFLCVNGHPSKNDYPVVRAMTQAKIGELTLENDF
jgi:hypothetical protein